MAHRHAETRHIRRDALAYMSNARKGDANTTDAARQLASLMATQTGSRTCSFKKLFGSSSAASPRQSKDDEIARGATTTQPAGSDLAEMA